MTAIHQIDMNGREIELGDAVKMPFPNESGTDSWNYDFVGIVIDSDEEHGIITVTDQDDDCFDIEPSRVEIV